MKVDSRITDDQVPELVLDIVRNEFEQLDERHILLISKTQTLSTIAAIVFSAISGSLIYRENLIFENYSMIGAFILASAGLLLCLWCLNSKEFKRPNYGGALKDLDGGKSLNFIIRSLIATYDEAISGNKTTGDKMNWFFDWAVKLNGAAFSLAIVSIGLGFCGGR